MFFSKKNRGPDVTDIVFMGESGCNNAIAKWLQDNNQGIVVAWFQHELEQLRTKLGSFSENRFVLADRLVFSLGAPKPILFAGHYPIHSPEMDLCEKTGLDKMLVYTHLDAPLFKIFGSDRIKELMIKMGMNEDEPVNHSMITSAIIKAQEKIAKEYLTDMHSSSEEEWFRLNITGK